MPGALANPGTKTNETNETNEANAVTKVTKVTKRKIISTLLDQRGWGFTVE